MASIFSSKTVITNPAELFGRKTMLSQLLSLAKNGNSVAVIGPRRFGKSSLLKCVESTLKFNSDSKVYPVYFDFKEVGSIIKGTDNTYKYMISTFISSLYKDNHFRDKIEIKKVNLVASEDWEDVFESLSNVNSVRIQGVFEELISFFSEYIGKSVLFLIDEYEWLFRFSFDSPVGFMKLRNFSSKQITNGINPFSFWIAGATQWDYLCSITGSPELNVIDAPVIHVDSIDRNSFFLMWDFELAKLEEYPDSLKTCCESVFNASGGVPFYGKLLGSHIMTSNKPINYKQLQPHFQELYNSLPSEEKIILNALALLPRNFKNSKHLMALLDKGLIFPNGKSYDVKGGFLKDFIKDNYAKNESEGKTNLPESHIITDKIENLILSINQTHHNKKGKYLFEPVVDESALLKDLRTPCYSIELFSDFSSSLYKIVFERTKENIAGKDVTLKRFPKPYKRGHQFIDIVDIMRHSLGKGHLMDQFTPRKGQLTKVKMLEILTGSKNEPSTSEDFYRLQNATLKLFEKELNVLNGIMRSML